MPPVCVGVAGYMVGHGNVISLTIHYTTLHFMACLYVCLSDCVMDRCRPHYCYCFRSGCLIFCLCAAVCLCLATMTLIASTHLCTHVHVSMCVCECVCVYGLGPDGNRLAVALPAYTSTHPPACLSLYSLTYSSTYTNSLA